MKKQSGIVRYGKALKDPGLWLDALCCWLMAIGLSRAFDQLFDFHATLAETVAYTFLVTVVLVLLTRKAWVLPALAGAGLLIYLLILVLQRRLGLMMDYYAGFLNWWTQLFPPRSSYSTPENMRTVIRLVQLAITCCVFFAVRRIRSVIAMGIACLVFFAIVVLCGFRENIPAMVWIFAGMLPLIARNAAWAQDKASRMHPAAAQAYKRPKGRRLTPAWPVQLSAIALCAAVSVLMAGLLPLDTSHWTSASMRRMIEKWGDDPLVSPDPLIGLPMELEDMGLADDAGRLGGPLGDRSSEVVLTMKSTSPLLLKATTYLDYTGSGWTTEWNAQKSGAHDFLDDRYLNERLEAFDRDKPIASNKYLFDQVVKELQPEITLQYKTQNLLVNGRVGSVNTQTAMENNPLRYNNRGELFVERDVTAPFTYSLSTQILPRSNDRERKDLSLLASATYDYRREDDLYDKIRKTYLQLPQDLPSRINETAREAVKGKFTAYDKAEALERYLSENFRYTETPSEVPAGRDFVDYFLETGEGYCVYYATAMTVMARSLGIPARFVCGFGVEKVGNQNYEARGYDAHAWVECYVQGIGWITFDPTATSSYLNVSGGSGGPPGTGEQQRPTTSQGTAETTGITRPTESGTTQGTTAQTGQTEETRSPTSGTGAGGETAPGQTGEAPGNSSGVVLLLIGLGTVLLLLVAVIWRMKACDRRCRLKRVRQKYTDRSRQAEFYYQDFLRQVALLGYTPLANETMKQFAQRVLSGGGPGKGKREVPPVPASAATVFQVIMDWRYGQQEPDDGEVAALAALQAELEKTVRSYCHPLKYFFVRRLGIG